MDWKELIPEFKKYITEFGVNIISAIVILVFGLWLAKLITKILTKVIRRKDVNLHNNWE